MAENDNLNQGDNGSNEFDHPIRRNNWWLYILGGLCFVGLIIWFFLEWHHKSVEGVTNDKDMPPVEAVQMPQVQQTDTLPQLTVDAPEETPVQENNN